MRSLAKDRRAELLGQAIEKIAKLVNSVGLYSAEGGWLLYGLADGLSGGTPEAPKRGADRDMHHAFRSGLEIGTLLREAIMHDPEHNAGSIDVAAEVSGRAAGHAAQGDPARPVALPGHETASAARPDLGEGGRR